MLIDYSKCVPDKNNRVFDVFTSVSTVNLSTVDSKKFLDIGSEHKYFQLQQVLGFKSRYSTSVNILQYLDLRKIPLRARISLLTYHHPGTFSNVFQNVFLLDESS